MRLLAYSASGCKGLYYINSEMGKPPLSQTNLRHSHYARATPHAKTIQNDGMHLQHNYLATEFL